MAPLEARVHPRAGFVDKISVIASASAAPLRLWSMNLSEGGVCLQTSHPFRRGDRVGLRIPCGDTELAIAVSEVAWVLRDVKGSSRLPAVGLRFVNLRPPERTLLKQLVERQKDRPDDDADGALPPFNPPGPDMHTEPSLPPQGPSINSIPPTAETLPPSELHEAEPSLGPLPSTSDPGESAQWAFSDAGPERPSPRARGGKESGNNNFVLAAGLLVVGTVAGMIFGLLDQSGRPSRKEAAIAAATAETAPVSVETAADVEPAPAPVKMPAPAPAPVKTAAPAPIVTQPVKKAEPVKIAAPAPAPVKTEKKAAAPLPVPNHRPGTVTLGALSPSGKDLVLPIRGARSIERQFTLKGPDRVVVDLTADAYDGPAELKGKGAIRSVRVGKRPGGVRLVLDVTSARAASAARISRTQGTLALVVPAR